MTKIVLITGATSGIGEATANKFASEGYDIIITGRREEILKTLSQKLKEKYAANVLPLVFDVRNKEEVKLHFSMLESKWRKIDVLVNNAGLSLGLNPIHEGLEEDWENMIDTNVKGLLYVSKIVIPWMIENKSGHIINIGSIAGKETYANNNVYCASKFAVDSVTRTMRIDLLPYSIRVTLINPGAVETEFSIVRFKGDKDKASKVYDGFVPLKGEDVAETVFFASALPAHVNINELTVVPTAQASPFYCHKSDNT